MAKDPFKEIPQIESSDLNDDSSQSNAQANQDITSGTTPRNLLSGLSKVGMPLIGCAILVWLFLPDSGHTQKRPEETQVIVDKSKQINDTSALLENLKGQAEKVPTPIQIPPIQEGNAIPLTGIKQPAIVPAAFDSDASRNVANEKIKREDEVRASPLDISNVQLMNNADISTQPKSSNLDTLKSEIAAINAKRDAVAIAQQDAQAKMLSALNPQTPKKRNVNEEFLAEHSTDSQMRAVYQQAPLSNTMLMQGTIVRSVLLSAINSDLPGSVSAQVTSDIYDSINHKYLMIPKGSKLYGEYKSEVVVGQERLLIAMTRMILPNGTWVQLSGAPAANMIGQSGIEAKVNNHFFKIFSSSLILGGASLLLPNSQNTVSTTATAAGNLTTGTVAGRAFNDALDTVMQRNKNIAPTLSAGPGQEFIFIISQDMIMEPYKAM